MFRGICGYYSGVISEMPLLNFSKCKNISSIFYQAQAIKKLPMYDFSNVEEASSAFYRMSSIDTSVNYYAIFSNMPNLKSARNFLQWTPFKIEGEALHFPKMLDPAWMFNCINITSLPKIYFSEDCTQLYFTFKQAEQLTGTLHFPQILSNQNKGLACCGAFEECYKIEEIIFDYIYVSDGLDMFYKDSKLKLIKTLDLRYCNRTSKMFFSCTALETLIIKYLNYSLSVKNCANLTLETLIGLCKECVKSEIAKTLSINSACLEKLSTVYVKLTDKTEDNESYPKLPCAVCESTDEGAMLISDYMALKNWTLA